MNESTKSALSKVPEVTLVFWIIKIAATTLGETGGDSVTMTLNWGYLVGTAILLSVLVVSPYRQFVEEGSLMSYGPDTPEIFRRSASYIDRILKGELPGNLPVQSPDKFELVVNLRTAKALGLSVRESFLLLADEVIE